MSSCMYNIRLCSNIGRYVGSIRFLTYLHYLMQQKRIIIALSPAEYTSQNSYTLIV